MTSYEELTPESREQVDATMFLMTENGIISAMDELEYHWVEEHVSNLVQTCIYIEKKQDNKAVILTRREWRSLSRAFLNLYFLLSEFPTDLSRYFEGHREHYHEIIRWKERLDRKEFD